ncbi:retrovirus-related pol polyprotein from transposon TNT 1-94 [Tanacetum coccineum]
MIFRGPVTTEEKVQKKNDVKARSILLMALPNEHLMTFNQYKDAKTLFAAIQTRFGESLDFIFNRLQKIVSQLAILGENISQEDLNLKFLRSLPSEWNTHVVVWRNKPDLDTMSFDDLYNNFKIVEQEVKGTASSSSSSSSQNMAFVSSPSSTNEVNTAYGVSTANTQVSPASTQVSTASTQVSTANLSDDTVYAFLASQPNGSQLVYEDLEQIHEDDIEEMDLKWQLALLSMRTRRFFQKTGRKITINGSDTAGYDKSKVECFNCHKMGHFARECRGPRNQDSRNRNQDSSRRTVNVEETSSKAMVAIDGAGFDWSYMADDEVPTNMALMAFSDSEVHNDKTCSKTYLKGFETLKTQLDNLRTEFNKSEFNLATYKRGLASMEEQLVFYKKNEVIFCEQLAVLKRDISYKDSELSMLNSELEKLEQEKESNQLKIENFDNASKSLDKFIGSKITDKSRKGVGFVSYNALPPPFTGLFSLPKFDLSNSGLEEFQQPEFKGYGPKTSKSVSKDISIEVRESLDAPLVKELVSDDKLEKKTVFPTVAKIEFVRPKQQEKPVRKPVKYAEMYRSQSPRGNQRNWNNQKLTAITNKGKRWSVTTAHPKTTVYSARPMSRYSKSAQSTVNAVKASACWVWRPTKLNSASITLKKHNYVDARGRSKLVMAWTLRNLMEDMLPLGEEPNEGKLLVKELLKLMCAKKNSVLFTDTRCFVLSPDFKLADESQATLDESMLWHRRLGHVNFKTINKLVKENLVRGLPSKHFENDQTCVACLKGKQHKASCKSKIHNSITQPLFMLHMDLFGLTFVSSLMNKKYYLVITDDYSRFTWVFFLASKDETSGILNSYITEIENLVDKKQNGVAERRNRILIEAVKTMLADSKLPITFWAEVVNTACYVQNRASLMESQMKDSMVGYSLNSKAFRVYNIRTRKVEENFHIRFLEDKPIIEGDGPKWLFDIDVLTKSMNYVPVVAGTNSNDLVGTEESIGACHSSNETGSSQDYILMPLWKDSSLFDSSLKNASNDEPQPSSDAKKKDDEGVNKESGIDDQERPKNSTQDVNTARPSINTPSTNVNTGSLNINNVSPTATTAPLEATHANLFGDETEIDMSNITTTYLVHSFPNTRIHKDHSLDHVIGDVQSGVQTRRMIKTTNEQGFISYVYEGKTHEDLHTCLFACFLSQEEPKRVTQALKDPSWIKALQEELLQFKLQQVWTFVDLPHGKRASGTKWVYRNKKDERGIVIRNKARLVAQGYTQEEGIDYDEVFASLARIEAIRLFLAYASFKDFVVYQMDVMSAFLYDKIEEEVYVYQPLGFEDPEFPNIVYKRGQIDKTLFIKRVKSDILLVQVYVDDIIFGSTKKELCTEFEKLMHKKFQMSSIGELNFFLGLQVTQKDDGILISQDKYVDEILKKFGFSTVKTASTPMETSKPLMKDENTKDVDVHLYRSMIGSLMYLTSSRPDIMFVVCACVKFQVTPKVLHLLAVKRIFRYLKGQPKLGLWYPKDSPFDWKLILTVTMLQTVVANSTTEVEYVAAASCCGHVLWIQNQMLDYGYNFMNTKIFIDNESTICIVKNLMFHSKTKHIEIRHHFIRDSNEKKLIQMIKIHTDQNVAISISDCKYRNA